MLHSWDILYKYALRVYAKMLPYLFVAVYHSAAALRGKVYFSTHAHALLCKTIPDNGANACAAAPCSPRPTVARLYLQAACSVQRVAVFRRCALEGTLNACWAFARVSATRIPSGLRVWRRRKRIPGAAEWGREQTTTNACYGGQ